MLHLGMGIAYYLCMKKSIIIFLLLNLSTYAGQFTYVIGGVTPHIQKPEGETARPLCNELSEGSGVIYNELNSYRYKDEKWTYGAIVGENSYCEPIWGYTQSYSFIDGNVIEILGTAGFYHFDEKGFDFSKGAYFSRIGSFYFVPVVGAEVNFNIVDSKYYSVKLMNLITPVVSHHAIGLEFNF